MIYPPLSLDFRLPSIQVETEHGEQKTLDSLLVKPGTSGVTLLIPGFTRCHGTCPLLIQTYKKLLSSTESRPISVLFFSFNPEDTAEDLQTFHTEQEAPKEWLFLRADAPNTQHLLDSLQFTTMKVGGQFDHPVQAFAFSANGTWVGSLYGLEVTPNEVAKIYATSEREALSPTLYHLVAQIKNPNTMAIYGGGVCLLSLLVIFYFLVFKKNKRF
jgi:cytochrome oxidase Cu insertion factor (SCO1/SenC/PrrC family)